MDNPINIGDIHWLKYISEGSTNYFVCSCESS